MVGIGAEIRPWYLASVVIVQPTIAMTSNSIRYASLVQRLIFKLSQALLYSHSTVIRLLRQHVLSSAPSDHSKSSPIAFFHVIQVQVLFEQMLGLNTPVTEYNIINARGAHSILQINQRIHTTLPKSSILFVDRCQVKLCFRFRFLCR